MSNKLQYVFVAEEDYSLIGISYHLKDYRLSYGINKLLHFHLKKFPDFPIRLSGSEDYRYFSLYYFNDTDFCNEYFLLSNQTENIFLIPTYKQADFFLLIAGQPKPQHLDYCMKNLRKIPQVLTAFTINISTVKMFDQVLPELDVHVTNYLEKSKPKFLKKKPPSGK